MNNAGHNQAEGGLGAIVLANGNADKLAEEQGVAHKALIELGGRPMIEWVLDTLSTCPDVDNVVVSCLQDGAVAEALSGKATTACARQPDFLAGLEAGFAALGGAKAALLVTCDVPLLTPQPVAAVADEYRRNPEIDILYTMVEARATLAAFPGARRTFVRLRDGRFTQGALNVVSRRFVETKSDYLRQAFAARKSKLALGSLLGWSFVLRFAMGRLCVADIAARAEELLDCRVHVCPMPYAEIGFDVDSADDLHTVQERLGVA